MVRIVIVDDHELVLAAFKGLLDGEPDFEVVGVARSAREAVVVTARLRPDVALLDVAMPDGSGLAVVPELNDVEGMSIVLLTAGVDDRQRADAFRLGVRAIVEKGTTAPALFDAIRTVARGEYWRATPGLGERLAEPTAEAHAATHPHLTKREVEVLQAIVDGCSNREVATRLLIGEDTVKHHVSRLLEKTGAATRVELAMFAIHRRLLDS